MKQDLWEYVSELSMPPERQEELRAAICGAKQMPDLLALLSPAPCGVAGHYKINCSIRGKDGKPISEGWDYVCQICEAVEKAKSEAEKKVRYQHDMLLDVLRSANIKIVLDRVAVLQLPVAEWNKIKEQVSPPSGVDAVSVHLEPSGASASPAPSSSTPVQYENEP